jgi:tetratricopeptide (TPR) repeat protein
MNKLLFLIPLLSITMTVAVAQSELNYEQIYNEGIALLEEGKDAAALQKFDQILNEDSNIKPALIAKGNLLAENEYYLEGHAYLYKAFSLDTNDNVVRANLNRVNQILKPHLIEGHAEIQIRDSNGYLVSFVKTNPGQIQMLEHPSVYGTISTWNVMDTFTRDGKEFQTFQFTDTANVPTNSVWGNTGLSSPLNPYFMVISAAHWGYPVSIGDTLTVTWTVTLPSEKFS